MTAFPAERAEATRILMVVTRGTTVLAGGIDSLRDGEIKQLTADVLFGTRGLRDGLVPSAPHWVTPIMP